MSETLEVHVGGKVFDDLDTAVDYVIKTLEQSQDRAASKITRELRHALQRVAKEMEEKHSGPWNGSVVNSGDRLQRRSGAGLKSILESIRVRGTASLSTMEGQISTGTMTIHETGGVITAKSGRYLTIPLPAALDSRGVPLRPSARDWDNTFVQRSRKGNLIIFQKRSQGIVPLYVLKSSVTIKPRLGMESAFMSEIPVLQERLLDLIAAEFKL